MDTGKRQDYIQKAPVKQFTLLNSKMALGQRFTYEQVKLATIVFQITLGEEESSEDNDAGFYADRRRQRHRQQDQNTFENKTMKCSSAQNNGIPGFSVVATLHA
eukprot:CFRG2705T1